MTEPAEPIRKGLLPPIPPSEWEFHTVYGARTGTDGCALFPGDTGPVVVRRRVTFGDWEPVRPDRWADEPAGDARPAAAGVAPAADQTWPSRRAGLRDEIAAALEAADYRMDMRRGDLADAVMPVLYREWPWLRAEAEDAAAPPAAAPAVGRAALRTVIATAIARYDWNTGLSGRVTASTDHYGEADAVLAVLPDTSRAAVLYEAAGHLAAMDPVEAALAGQHAWQDAAKELRRMADEAQQQPCAECGHPQAAHREGDDPVTPGVCNSCPDDDAHHDYEAAGDEQQPAADTKEPRP